PCYPFLAGVAELPLAAARAFEPGIRPRDSCRIVAELFGARAAAADAQLGIDAEGSHAVLTAPAAGGVFSRVDDLSRHPRVQSFGRRLERYFRSAAVRKLKWTRR